MEISKESGGAEALRPQWWRVLASTTEKMIEAFEKVKKIGKDDPRRISHSLKVGLALTLVSVFYYVNPLFDGFGASTMWAVLTVVVVMEYTVGGTLGKGLNRAFATFLAGSLGVGAHHLASLAGDKGEPVIISLFVFLIAAAATFSRFIPEVKARYDYGAMIFILTFSLVAISGYRAEDLVRVAQQRLSTIAVGVAICLFITIIVFPVWAGQDLNRLVAGNLDKLASFCEGLGTEYFEEKVGEENVENKSFLCVYKSVLNSKATEDSLANFARWEPAHGKFSFRNPWRQYLKIGVLSRRCAYSVDTLAAYITASDKLHATATTADPAFNKKIRSACAEMSSESAKALSDFALSIRTMTAPESAAIHVANALAAAGRLKAAVPTGGAAISDVIRCATTASLLAQVVKSTHHIAGAVDELARTARFKKSNTTPELESEPEPVHKPAHVVVSVRATAEPETDTKPVPVHKAPVEPLADGENPPHVAIDVK